VNAISVQAECGFGLNGIKPQTTLSGVVYARTAYSFNHSSSAVSSTHGASHYTVKRIANLTGSATRGRTLILIRCLHDRANLEQLAGHFMVISILIRKAEGL